MHDHHHHEHHHGISSAGWIFKAAILLNLAFVIAESVSGFLSGSLGLLSDAGHNLGDVFSLMLALIAFKLASSHSSKRFTYGYRKSSVLISLLNAIILLVAVGAIFIESLHKLCSGSSDANADAIIWTAAAGILVNGLTTWMLSRGDRNDINTRGAFLHMLSDTLVSAGVVISGIVIKLTGWTFIDPVIGIVIAIIILISTWGLLAESIRMSIDAVPHSIDTEKVCGQMCQEEGVSEVHHVHIWPISTTEVALTAHVVIDDICKAETIIPALKKRLSDCGICHSTLEVETEHSDCHERDCCRSSIMD